MAKRFMFLSIGVLCLMLSALIGFHIGGQPAQAQVSEVQAGFRIMARTSNDWVHFVMTPTGDMYVRESSSAGDLQGVEARFIGNFWGSGPVPTASGTWGNVKGKYEGEE